MPKAGRLRRQAGNRGMKVIGVYIEQNEGVIKLKIKSYLNKK